MDITSVLLILTVALLATAFIFRPFISRKNWKTSKNENPEHVNKDHDYSSLLAEKERILSAIEELDFDNKLNKVPEDLYPIQRAEFMNRAAEVLKALDEMGVGRDETVGMTASKYSPDNGEYDEVEALIAKRRGEVKVKGKSFCPHCGQPAQASDRFCPKCGKLVRSSA
ncbi:MAG: hypothetical protein C0391_00325 [Anaerolinea sp.]|nr:hypothetical protein [Anaerolinea sp.]